MTTLFDATQDRLVSAFADRRALVPWHRIRQATHRLSWGVADQGVSSITNFAVNIYIARELGAVPYGAFSLAYVTYGFALNASRGLATDPLLVRFSGTGEPAWRRAVAKCTGTATVVGLVSGLLVAAAGLILGGPSRLAFLALGLTLPGLLLQDSWRFSFFALGRGRLAFLNDMIWAVAMLPALVFLHLSGHGGVFWFVFAWGAAAALAAVAGPLQARVIPRPGRTWEWLSAQRDLGVRYMAEGTASAASSQLRNYGVGLILGLAAVGYVQAANTLMGPFMVILYGSGLVVLPEAAKMWRRSPRRMPLLCAAISIGLVLCGLAWGLVLLFALPHGLGSWLLGSIWRPSYPLVWPTALCIMGSCATGGAGTGLHALGAARRSLRAAMITSALFVLFAVAGALLDGAVGCMYGTAIALWSGTALYWWELRGAFRETGKVTLGELIPRRRVVGPQAES